MNTGKIYTHTLGYPRIGEQRELKKAVEAYWKGQMSIGQLEKVGSELRKTNWLKQRASGIDLIPSNDFSFYDQVLDLSCMVGNVPPRFQWDEKEIGLDTRFLIARGQRGAGDGEAHGHDKDCNHGKISTFASEMTKWFDTNYHYIVPEFKTDTTFRLGSSKAISEFLEAQTLGIKTKPLLVGPVTYLTLGKVQDEQNPDFDRFKLFDRLLPVYIEVLKGLARAGAEWVQIDEPILALDLNAEQKTLLVKSCKALKAAVPGVKIVLAVYFGDLRDNLELACALDADVLHIDGIRAPQEIETVARVLPSGRGLSLGLVDGRNVWKNDFSDSLRHLAVARSIRGNDLLLVAPSCSLLHCPITLKNEVKLDAQIRNWLAFADEKLAEVSALRDLAEGKGDCQLLEANQVDQLSRRSSARIHSPEVKKRLGAVLPKDSQRASQFPRRQALQRAKLRLPDFPTTTIGSFPQTAEVRSARARWKKGDLSDSGYDAFLKEETRKCVAFQEEIGIDMLVHGEFERNDMVEYFGEQLEGFVFTANGWVQSYGSRCVKPPIIFGDVSRPRPMTAYWSEFAQTLTRLPMKGMLTGPVTILQWSFVRNDQPRDVTTRQIALAIRDEVIDLEKIGIAAIQIDEPAIREGLPLRRSDWENYLNWAVQAFRLCASGVRDETQIHTHMCYSEFNDIIHAIAGMDADVITIETSRSNMELLEAFVNFKYPLEIGPGVYDIHSPRVPRIGEMENLLQKAISVLPPQNVWVNPDCGLKTRGWLEVKASLQNMVEAARHLRKQTSVAVTETR